ncbi:hypothetical protein VCHA36P166_290029 [Vibrio chagasii]|nr:hypothetical protein VCHA36P166_290029 [Vibrio chagasii]
MNNSQAVKFDYEDISLFVASLYADDKKPCEGFNMSWDELSELDQETHLTDEDSQPAKKCA